MPRASEWLAEVVAHDGSGEITLRYSVSGYASKPGDNPANTYYDGRISAGGIGSFVRHLFGVGRTIGEVTIEPGELILANADGDLDGLVDYGFDGRSVTLRRLADKYDALSTAKTVLMASGEGVSSESGFIDLRLRFYDRRRDLDKPIQTNKYGGTTTSGLAGGEDGTPDMKGQVKPLAFGSTKNVPGALVDPYNLIIQVNDGAVNSITAYDGGVPLSLRQNYSSASALRTSTGNPGQYSTCLSAGLWKPHGSFNGRPAYVWTADVVQGASPSARTAAGIVASVLDKLGLVGDADSASFNALRATAPQQLGIYIDTETTALSVIRQVMDSVGAWIVPDNTGKFVVGRFEAPGTPVMEIVEPEILTASASDTIAFTQNPDTDGNIPAYRMNVKWGRYYHVHSDSDLAGCVSEGNPARATELKTEWREASSEDANVQAKYLLSPEMSLETALTDATDAANEAARRLALYAVRRESVRVAIRLDEADDAVLGATVTLKFPRLGYSNGKAMRIIGREDAWVDEQAILTLWG